LNDLIRDTEDKIRRETEVIYIDRIQELERKSVYLDRSLEIIEDMKSRF